MLLFVGIPAFAIELIIGQYSGCGPLTAFSAVPLFSGSYQQRHTFRWLKSRNCSEKKTQLNEGQQSQAELTLPLSLPGIGWGMLLITSMLSIFYTMLLGWALYYLIASFQSQLPWDHCQHDYNSDCKRRNFPYILGVRPPDFTDTS